MLTLSDRASADVDVQPPVQFARQQRPEGPPQQSGDEQVPEGDAEEERHQSAVGPCPSNLHDQRLHQPHREERGPQQIAIARGQGVAQWMDGQAL